MQEWPSFAITRFKAWKKESHKPQHTLLGGSGAGWGCKTERVELMHVEVGLSVGMCSICASEDWLGCGVSVFLEMQKEQFCNAGVRQCVADELQSGIYVLARRWEQFQIPPFPHIL